MTRVYAVTNLGYKVLNLEYFNFAFIILSLFFKQKYCDFPFYLKTCFHP